MSLFGDLLGSSSLGENNSLSAARTEFQNLNAQTQAELERYRNQLNAYNQAYNQQVAIMTSNTTTSNTWDYPQQIQMPESGTLEYLEYMIRTRFHVHAPDVFDEEFRKVITKYMAGKLRHAKKD